MKASGGSDYSFEMATVTKFALHLWLIKLCRRGSLHLTLLRFLAFKTGFLRLGGVRARMTECQYRLDVSNFLFSRKIQKMHVVTALETIALLTLGPGFGLSFWPS